MIALFVKSAVVFALAALALRLSARRSAATRALIAQLAFVAVALLPFAGARCRFGGGAGSPDRSERS
jgi:hypothetical protein